MVLGTTLNLQLVANVFRHLLRLPISCFEKRPPRRRRVALRVAEHHPAHADDELPRGADRRRAWRSSRCAMMFWYSGKLALIVLAAAALYGAAAARALPSAAPRHRRADRARGQAAVDTSSRPCAACRASSCSTAQLQRGARASEPAGRPVQRQHRARNGCTLLYRAAQRRAVRRRERGGDLARRAARARWRGFSVGMLFAFIAYKEQFVARVERADRQGDRAEDAGPARRAPRRHRADRAGARRRWRRASARRRDGAIELRGVSFRYSDVEPLVLNDVNLRIEAGESVAIVGPSGCGKTTLLKLMLGLLRAAARAKSLIGGVPLAAARASRAIATRRRGDAGRPAVRRLDRRQHRFFDPAPDHERIERAPSSPRCTTRSLRCRWATTRWSATWARCFRAARSSASCSPARCTSSRDILLLDEATSHLDVTRERQVNEAIQQLNLTRIIIAHRPETIASANA